MHIERVELASVAGASATGSSGVRDREGSTFCLAECLFGATGGTEMIGARVHVIDDDGGFTIVACAESFREVEQTAKALHPKSTVRIAFPIEPECFFAGGPRPAAPVVERRKG